MQLAYYVIIKRFENQSFKGKNYLSDRKKLLKNDKMPQVAP